MINILSKIQIYKEIGFTTKLKKKSLSSSRPGLEPTTFQLLAQFNPRLVYQMQGLLYGTLQENAKHGLLLALIFIPSPQLFWTETVHYFITAIEIDVF